MTTTATITAPDTTTTAPALSARDVTVTYPDGRNPDGSERLNTVLHQASLDVARGELIAAADPTPPEPVKEIAARLAWLGETPLRPRSRVLLKHGTATVKAMVGEIVGALDLETMQLGQAQSLELNDIGSVVLRTPSALPLDDYAQLRRTGAFLLIDEQSGNTLAAGLVGEG